MTNDDFLRNLMRYYRAKVLTVFLGEPDKYEVRTDDFSGEVRTNPFLAQAPDVDGDGVTLCADKCPGTEAGALTDADGCPLAQLVDFTTGPGQAQPACCGAAGIAIPLFMVGYVALLAVRRKRRA